MVRRVVPLFVLVPALALAQPKTVTFAPKAAPPKLEAVAETKLLMEGIAATNFRGLEKMLADGPADAEGWAFGRGQALLVAESANLLMLRPPKTAAGQEAWMARSGDMRDAATRLARFAAAKKLPESRLALRDLAAACNKCHETFRVETRIKPFAEKPE